MNYKLMFYGVLLGIVGQVVAQALYMPPTAACYMSMKRTAIENPAYFKRFWEDVAKEIEEK